MGILGEFYPLKPSRGDLEHSILGEVNPKGFRGYVKVRVYRLRKIPDGIILRVMILQI